MTDLSIVLPTYNERDNIVPLVERLLHGLSDLGDGLEVIIVDDNSPDGTAALAREAFAGDRRIRVLVRTTDRGLARAIRAGIECASGHIVLVMDTDFNHPPDQAPLLYNIARHVDLVVGSRFAFGGGMPSRTRYVLSYVYNLFMRFVLGTRINDNLSGLFAIRREALQKLDFDKIFWGYGDYFFRLLLMSQRLGLRHVEVPVLYGERRNGQSKIGIPSIFLLYTREVFRIVALRFVGKW